MTHRELTIRLATAMDISRAQAARWLKATTDELSLSLREGLAVSIPDWGTFDTTMHEERQGFLPHLQRITTLAKRRLPVFRPSEGLRDDVHDLEEFKAGYWI